MFLLLSFSTSFPMCSSHTGTPPSVPFINVAQTPQYSLKVHSLPFQPISAITLHDMNADIADPCSITASKFLDFNSYNLHCHSKIAIKTTLWKTPHHSSGLLWRWHFKLERPQCPSFSASPPVQPHEILLSLGLLQFLTTILPGIFSATFFLIHPRSLTWTTQLPTINSLALLLHVPIFPSCLGMILPLLH